MKPIHAILVLILFAIVSINADLPDAMSANLGLKPDNVPILTDELFNFRQEFCKDSKGKEFYQGDLVQGDTLISDLEAVDESNKGLFQIRVFKGIINEYDDVGRSFWIKADVGMSKKPKEWIVDTSNPGDFRVLNSETQLKSINDFNLIPPQKLLVEQGLTEISPNTIYTVVACKGTFLDPIIRGEKQLFYKVSLLGKPLECKVPSVMCSYFEFRKGQEQIRVANKLSQFEKKYFTQYLDCPSYEKELAGSQYKLITIQSQVLYGGDLVNYVGNNPENARVFQLMFRGGVGEEYNYIAEDTTGNMELIPDGTGVFNISVNNIVNKDLKSSKVDITKPGKINQKDYYEFNGCGLYDTAAKRLIGVYKLHYHVTEGGPTCDCEKCCRTGGYFGPTHGKVGCMKKIRKLRSAVAMEFKMLNQFLDVEMKKYLTNENFKGLEQEIFKDQVITDYMDKMKIAKEELQQLDECVNCNALSRQFFKLWNHDKWLDSFSREKGNQFLKREDIGSFEGWDRTDPNMFAVCDVCLPNPKGKRKTSCANIELEQDRLKDKHKEIGYSDKLFNKKTINDILRPMGSVDRDKNRKYAVTHLNLNTDNGEEIRRKAGALSSGGEMSSNIDKSNEDFTLEKKNSNVFYDNKGAQTSPEKKNEAFSGQVPTIKSQTEKESKTTRRRFLLN